VGGGSINKKVKKKKVPGGYSLPSIPAWLVLYKNNMDALKKKENRSQNSNPPLPRAQISISLY